MLNRQSVILDLELFQIKVSTYCWCPCKLSELYEDFTEHFCDFIYRQFMMISAYLKLYRILYAIKMEYIKNPLQILHYEVKLERPLQILHHETKLEHAHNYEKLDAFQCHFIIIQDYESDQIKYHKEEFYKEPNMSLIPEEIFTAYKRVDKKVRPVPATFPEDAKVQRRIPEDPLKTLSILPTHPPEFIPTQKITSERVELMGINNDKFL